LHGLHRLADEEPEQRFLARLALFDLVGVGGEDVIERGLDYATVTLLGQAFALDGGGGDRKQIDEQLATLGMEIECLSAEEL
jgi:hypothetical protein